MACESKSKLSTVVTPETSATKPKSKRLTAVRSKTTEHEEEQLVVITDLEHEVSRAEPDKMAEKIPDTIFVPGQKRDKRPGPFNTEFTTTCDSYLD